MHGQIVDNSQGDSRDCLEIHLELYTMHKFAHGEAKRRYCWKATSVSYRVDSIYTWTLVITWRTCAPDEERNFIKRERPSRRVILPAVVYVRLIWNLWAKFAGASTLGTRETLLQLQLQRQCNIPSTGTGKEILQARKLAKTWFYSRFALLLDY